jgi:hypothetical protein
MTCTTRPKPKPFPDRRSLRRQSLYNFPQDSCGNHLPIERYCLVTLRGLGGWMGEDGQYFWAVLCKNHRFHKQQNLFFAHKIPLAETDAFLPPPALSGPSEGPLRRLRPGVLLRAQRAGQNPTGLPRALHAPPAVFVDAENRLTPAAGGPPHRALASSPASPAWTG